MWFKETRRHIPGAEAPLREVERPKAEALGYLEATAKARTTADSSAALRNDNKKNKGKCYCGYFHCEGVSLRRRF
jgi:hypothetical protein